jgi:hypothetical protein
MLSILPYHRATTRYFQDMAPVWDFFASHKHKSEQLVEFKTDLLKNSYKFDVDGDPDIYSKVQMVKDKLGLHIPVFVYQAQHSEEMNASIVYLNEEAHIVFTGRLIDAMTQDELLAIIAHELSHVELYRQLNGAVEVADRIITAIANHSGSTPAHYETARLFKLYTEIFCDRGAYLVTGNYAPIISSLVKIATGLQTVNPDSYIKQADEIFTVDANTKTMGITHPENFIRARAIWLWHTKGAEAESQVEMMIEGKTSLDELDLFQQKTVSGQTQKLIQLILQPRWMQTAHTIALSKQYFSSQDLSGSIDINQFAELVERLHPGHW